MTKALYGAAATFVSSGDQDAFIDILQNSIEVHIVGR